MLAGVVAQDELDEAVLPELLAGGVAGLDDVVGVHHQAVARRQVLDALGHRQSEAIARGAALPRPEITGAAGMRHEYPGKAR